MIHLATATDDAYAPGLCITMVSALRSLSLSEEVVFHVIDGGLKPDSIQNIKDLSGKHHPRCKIIFHKINKQIFDGWQPGPNNSMMAYARLLLGSIIDAGKVIYLDADTLILSDLSKLWNTPMNGMVVLASRGGENATLKDDCPWSLPPGEENLPYFNSGIIVFDLNQWRIQGKEMQAVQLLSGAPTVYRFHDQTILNYMLRHQVGLLSMTWNWQERITSEKQASSVKIIHFITQKKPWFWWSGDLRFRLWRSFYATFIGSPLKLFMVGGALSGFLFGNFEIQIRRHPWMRAIYVRFLIISCIFKKSESSAKAAFLKRHYYTQGLGGKMGDAELKRNQALLKTLIQRMKSVTQAR